jgi:hypothetical protein
VGYNYDYDYPQPLYHRRSAQGSEDFASHVLPVGYQGAANRCHPERPKNRQIACLRHKGIRQKGPAGDVSFLRQDVRNQVSLEGEALFHKLPAQGHLREFQEAEAEGESLG